MKVLITSVSAGAGHVRAAQALEAAFREAHAAVEVRHIDAMDFVSKAFRKAYTEGYLSMVNRAPALWGYLYDLSDRSSRTSPSARAFEALQRYQASDLFDEIEAFSPNRILATHFFLPQIYAHKKRRKRRAVPPIDVVVTDYDIHRFWLEEAAERYFVATEEIAHRLRRWGVAPDRVKVTGIPIHPVFSATPVQEKILRELDLRTGLPTLLLLSGGLGVGALEKTVRVLCGIGTGLQIISVAGRNKRLAAEIAGITPPENVRLRSLGFVSNMEELLSIADLVVTKPGGLTTSECLAKGAAMVVVAPIPGQEERNSDFILEHGAGIKAHGLEELEYKIARLLADAPRIEAMKKAARSIARPRAAFEIAEAVVATNPAA